MTHDSDANYQRQLAAESRKWGDHLAVEAAGTWNAWLDHPLILQHYQQRGLIEGAWWARWVQNALNGPAQRSLDLGCGSGSRSFEVYRQGSSLYVEGSDVSEDRIALAEKIRMESGIAGRFMVADSNIGELPAQSYDLIFSAHSFHHFLQLEHIMEQVRRALTPRGLFILEEYVGPTQFQWTAEQIDIVRSLTALIPDRLRLFRWGATKMLEGRPSPAEVAAVSPFELIRSIEICPLFKEYFSIVAAKPLGGTIQHLLYNGIIHNFRTDDDEAVCCIRSIAQVEDALIDQGLLPSDFMLLIGRAK